MKPMRHRAFRVAEIGAKFTGRGHYSGRTRLSGEISLSGCGTMLYMGEEHSEESQFECGVYYDKTTTTRAGRDSVIRIPIALLGLSDAEVRAHFASGAHRKAWLAEKAPGKQGDQDAQV